MNLICAELKKRNNTEEPTPLFSSESISQWYSFLKNEKNEVFILNTCHRFMILIHNECMLTLQDFFKQFDLEEAPEYCFNEEAVLHFFSVISGLQSPILGENEILGQVKRSWEEAVGLNTIGTFMNELINKAVSTGKSARSNTALVKLSDTYSSVTYKYIKKQFDNIKYKKILILGTGKLGIQLLNYFQNKSILPVTIASHSEKRAKQVAGERAEGVAIADIEDALVHYDIIIGATETELPIWEFDLQSLPTRVIVDLGRPANFKLSPESSNVYYYSLKDIETNMGETRQAKIEELPKVMKIVQEAVDKFRFWYNTRKVAPIIQSFNSLTASIKEEEYAWAVNKLGDMSPQQLDVVQKLIFRVVSRMSSSPISTIKNYAQNEEASAHIEAFKDLFNID